MVVVGKVECVDRLWLDVWLRWQAADSSLLFLLLYERRGLIE